MRSDRGGSRQSLGFIRRHASIAHRLRRMIIRNSSAGRGAQGRGNETNGPAFLPDLAASWLERSCAGKANSLLQLVIEDLYPGRIALVSSFGADAAALLHMVSQIDKATPVVFVDTGQHFPETLAYRDEICAFLGLTNVIVAEPKAETMAQQDPEKLLFMSDPDRCCDIRKVRPLAAAIQVYDAWITGRKGFQTADRARLPLFESEGKRVKINPLVGWSASDVLAYIAEAGLPRHPLVAEGFPSIGCLPCTSGVVLARTRGQDAGAVERRSNVASTWPRSSRGRISDGPLARCGGVVVDRWVVPLRGRHRLDARKPGTSAWGRFDPFATAGNDRYLRIPAVHRINLKGQLWARQYALRERRLAGTRATHTARRCRCLRNGLVAGLWKPMSKAAKTA